MQDIRSLTSQSARAFNTIHYLVYTNCLLFACGTRGTEVTSDIKYVSFTPSSLFSRDQQAAVGSLLRMERFLPNTCECTEKKMIAMKKDLIDILTPPFANRPKFAHVI